MNDFLQRLKQRKLVQWSIGYIAAAFSLIQGTDVVASQFGWPESLRRGITLALTVGFFVMLVIAWFHGERGAQRVSRLEVLLIVLVLEVGGVAIWHYEQPPASAKVAAAKHASRAHAAQAIPAKSVAVLPFENLSGDPNEKYFSDGITEEILNALAQIPNLKVAGRTSAFQFQSKGEDLHKVGAMLGVANVLEGSVQKVGDEVRINVQLVDTHSGYQRWSEKYDRKLTNIFAIEDDISNAIAGKLRVQLTGGAGQALVAQKTVDPRAHDFYLRGLTLLAARGPGLRDAVAAFQNAVQIEPQYADAWGALAEAQALYPDYGLGTMQAAYPSALADAQRALTLDPDLASAYVAQGMVYKDQWRWPEADQAFRHALTLVPGDAEAIDQYGQFLGVIGQFKPALVEIERAQRLDPLSGIIGLTRAYTLLKLRRNEEAATQIESVTAAHPDFALAHADAVQIYIALHRYPEAEKQVRLFAKLVGMDPDAVALLVRGTINPALRARAVQSLETSAAFARMRRDPVIHAGLLAGLGARDQALDVLERFAVDRNSSHLEGLWSPDLDPIRNDPRFKAVLKKMGLPYTPGNPSTP